MPIFKMESEKYAVEIAEAEQPHDPDLAMVRVAYRDVVVFEQLFEQGEAALFNLPREIA